MKHHKHSSDSPGASDLGFLSFSTRFKVWPLKQLTVLSATSSGLKAGNCETNKALAENETANVLLSRTINCWHYINVGTMNMENWWNDADGENWNVGVEPDPVPLCPPQIQQGLVWDQTWASDLWSYWWMDMKNVVMRSIRPYICFNILNMVQYLYFHSIMAYGLPF